MDIVLSKKWRLPIALTFWVLWLGGIIFAVVLMFYWIPKFIVWLFNFCVSLGGTFHVMHVPFNFWTWLVVMILLFWTRIYTLNGPKETAKLIKRKINIRFSI